MADGKRFGFVERWLGRVHLAWWIAVDVIGGIAGGLGALWRSEPWWIVLLSAVGAFFLVAIGIAGLYVVVRLVLAKIKTLRLKLEIVIGNCPPFYVTEKKSIYKTLQSVSVGIRNNSYSKSLYNCELTLTKLSGTFSDKCPLLIASFSTINPRDIRYVKLASTDLSGISRAGNTTNYSINVYFPVNPLRNDKSNWLDDQPYELELRATASNTPPFVTRCRLAIEDGKLVLTAANTPSFTATPGAPARH